MSTIKVTTPPINRKEVAQAFGGNQTVIRQLEAMARDITTNIPGGVDDIAAFSEASVALLGRQNSAGLNAEHQVAELQTMLMTMRTLQSDISRLYGLVNEISAIVNATRQRAPSVNYTTIDGAPIGQSVPAAAAFTSVTIGSALSVSNGGTGRSTLTAHGVLLGEGSSAVNQTAVGTTGQMLLGVTGGDPAFGNNPTITGGTIDGAPVGSTTPAAVTGTTVKGTVFQSATSAVASAPSGTAVTVYTFANAAPMCWLVSSSLGFTSNDTTHYDLFAVVLTDGTSARVAFSNAGSNMSVALSGLNLQITQNSGATQPINTVLTRVG
ncbi:hypothetical protein KMC49_gp22 [Ralstonia phage Firinga]|uniref:Uncharacterized protein n=3 Tax=Firingavirus TaxID=2843381 RepID=A0A7G5B9W7_9CAUD|nr:hypothetical protein X532_gp11 [Ralstonia phage RSK1]YP_010078561.1 hypothetical protein KMC49_gp22 [Ralstonia phage Firinga]QMV33090.1 hypothetical protein 18C_00022 [Ralstonia phage Firinga]QMV33316.1 hypothetical protein 12C_00006 [Ralstonia phage Hennie]BAO04676.1 hypothetical protein [Ralstonia phage RSK1]